DYTLTVYQPQLDSWDGFKLSAHYALSFKKGKDGTATYGVAWVNAQSQVNKDDRMVMLDDIQLTKVHFPSAPDKEAEYLSLIRTNVVPKTKEISLDRLQEAAEVIEESKKSNISLKNDPPRIIFSSVPAILIYVDGNPVYKPLNGISLDRIINTRSLVVKDKSGKHYVHVFDGWLEASALSGPWNVTKKPSKDLAKTIELTKGQVDLLEGKSDQPKDPNDTNTKQEPPPSLSKGTVPKIYIATTATELIVTEGEPNYATLTDTDLLFVKNTTGHVFKMMKNGQSYVLVSGRWFSAPALNGPWTYVAANQLPPDFAKIPDDSPKENVKASVSGTSQAEEARIADSIPQTATVKRKEVKFEPKYDGQPQLKPIEQTPLQYVANSSAPVIMVDAKSYYSVNNAVWFASTSLNGPWLVADNVPAVIYSIPPSSPIYYVTYVKVYKSTPEVVYVGYTPGYYGTVVQDEVVVYGTGYYYSPWIGTVWYGPPATYGFGTSITYTPWTGWAFGFGFGWAWGAATVGWGWGCYPWWGPMGYYAYPYYWGGAAWGYRGAAVWGPGGWAATTGNVYHRWGDTAAVTRRSGGYDAWTGNAWRGSSGMSYNSRTGTIAAGQRGAVGNVFTGNYAYGGRGTVTNPTTGNTISGGHIGGGNIYNGDHRSAGYIKGDQGGVAHIGDNVYAGKDGNIYKRDDGGWDQLNKNGSWDGVKDQNLSRNLDQQHYQPRANGNMRANNFRYGGGRRGGGGFRRR
ncbi:autotransporter, partial [bacterium]|nr:autotransporter [bacterium]